jgi:2-dehydro-3-deoxyphosphogalactonate aldolase
VLKSLRAVLPPDIPLIPVGGIDETRFGGWLRAGAAGFGIGSALYRPGIKPPELRDRAHKLVAGLRRVLPMSASGAEAQPPNDR